MVYRLFKETKVALNREAAMALYAGILTDTGSFRYSNTSRFTHQAAAELLKFNIDVVQVYKYCYENIPFADMKTLAVMLGGIRREADGKVIWCQIPRTLLKKDSDTFDLGDHILSFCRSIKGVEVVALFREQFGRRDEVRVNFRSQSKVDVNKIASYFGGGGHKTAAGATVKGSLASVRRKVLQKIRQNLK
jgi:phosphoesterase RecJ-like protein